MADTKTPPPKPSRIEAPSPPKDALLRTVKMSSRPGARRATLGESCDAHGVEVIVVNEVHVDGAAPRAWRAAEVWTKRRVYALDSSFRCVEVKVRETDVIEAGHEMLGARLSGGRIRSEGAVRFSYPLPLPGMEAMFSRSKKHGYTSPVERMVVRIRLVETSSEQAPPSSWDDAAVRWSEAPPKP